MNRVSISGVDARTQRILKAAIDLAEEEGYESVRLRDLAARADVALGTVYHRFSSKEDILAAVLELEVQKLSAGLGKRGVKGKTAEDRLNRFFTLATHALAARPHLARTLLRAATSGVPEITEKVARYHGTMERLIVSVFRGEPVPREEASPSPTEQTLAVLIQRAWFALLVGWSGGLHDVDGLLEGIKLSVRVLLHGISVLEEER